MGKVSQERSKGREGSDEGVAAAAVAALGNRLPVYVSSVCHECVRVCAMCVCLLCLYVNTRTQNFMQC